MLFSSFTATSFENIRIRSINLLRTFVNLNNLWRSAQTQRNSRIPSDSVRIQIKYNLNNHSWNKCWNFNTRIYNYNNCCNYNDNWSPFFRRKYHRWKFRNSWRCRYSLNTDVKIRKCQFYSIDGIKCGFENTDYRFSSGYGKYWQRCFCRKCSINAKNTHWRAQKFRIRGKIILILIFVWKGLFNTRVTIIW